MENKGLGSLQLREAAEGYRAFKDRTSENILNI